MTVWRRKPKQELITNSDQGSQCSSGNWQGFFKANNLIVALADVETGMKTQSREFLSAAEAGTNQAKTIMPSMMFVRMCFDKLKIFYNAKRRNGFNKQL